MSSLKPEMFQLCKEVAGECEGWNFVGNVFKNKALKHTDLIVSPSFSFYGSDNPSCALQPAVHISHKKSLTLCKRIIGYEYSTSFVRFDRARDELKHYPVKMASLTIWRHKFPSFRDASGREQPWSEYWLSFDEAKPVLKGMLMDGIALINKYYDLSSEENLLRHLPIDQKTEGAEESMGVMLCIAHVLLGDFEFVERYRSDDFKTELPKRLKEVDAIIAALPELKRRYAETGSVM